MSERALARARNISNGLDYAALECKEECAPQCFKQVPTQYSEDAKVRLSLLRLREDVDPESRSVCSVHESHAQRAPDTECSSRASSPRGPTDGCHQLTPAAGTDSEVELFIEPPLRSHSEPTVYGRCCDGSSCSVLVLLLTCSLLLSESFWLPEYGVLVLPRNRNGRERQ